MRAGTTEAPRRDASGGWRGRLFNLALCAASGLFCLLAVEGILRVVSPPDPVFVREHPAFGFANIANKRGYWHRETERPVLVEINSKMLRDVERPYAKPADTTRVLMLGDSYIGAFNTPFDKIASRQLEGGLRASLGSERIEVVNAGTQGWGTAQELLYFRDEGRRYQADVVVLNFFLGNDFWNNYTRTAAPTKPSFSVENGELRFHPAALAGKSVTRLRDSVLAKSALARVIRRGPLPQLLGFDEAMVRLGLVSGEANPSVDDGVTRDMLEVTCLLVESLAREVAAAGGRLFVHLIPAPRDLVEFLPAPVRPEPSRNEEAARIRRALGDGLVACLERREIPTVFAWQRMLEDTRQGRLLFAEGIGHWTTEGNRRAAEDLQRALLPVVRGLVAARHLVPRPSAAGVAATQPPVSGDR